MIPYVEIIRETADGSLKTFSFVEPSQCWFELSYQDVGEFEIYCTATQKNLQALKKGYYVKIPNRRFGWVITSVQYEFQKESGVRMISAKGYELKWLLKKRIIQKPTQLSTNLFNAVHGLVDANIGQGALTERRIPNFISVLNSETITIEDTQVPRGNLLETVNTLLSAHSCGSTVFFVKGNANTYEMHFEAYKGQEKQNVRFSKSYDNLLSATYFSNDAEVGTSVFVVNTAEVKKTVGGEEITQEKEVFVISGGGRGSQRSEILLESKLSTKYEDANGVEKELDLNSVADLINFQRWLSEEGNSELTKHTTVEEVSGEIDLQNSLFKFDEDFFLGDLVRVQDEYFDINFGTRIAKATIKQDSSGYGEELEYKQ